MSKNVAVFVDVANIFYAAKAAGVDIDYVTLLRSATAGRDFVRAYAYTGLDPDNENQRNFHQFLSRQGYKVVSKDIRKYGDGKVKANLDIELVVDMMKTARNLDIAVLVSGDGDFAPAIRAVQEMGVRVEVVSFRGNTSSDLIDVADQFTDIIQIAKVEKGTRSGRRVAGDDEDLSMTEVPDKQTEGTGRGRGRGRARGRIAERAPAAATNGRRSRRPAREERDDAAGLVALPGEKLSKAAAARAEALAAGVAGEPDDAGELEAGAQADEGELDEARLDEAGRRRRRRRGGRGRGRGRGREEAPTADADADADGEPAAATGEPPEIPQDLPPTPRRPQSTPFGSVWDSQLGVPSRPAAGLEPLDVRLDEEDLEEPEIPEYLLAERRRARGGGRGPAGRGGLRDRRSGRGAYAAALDRERYGRGSGGGGINRYPDVSGRIAPRRDDRPMPRDDRPGRGAEPWSEVPPEVEQLLRAQLAQRTSAPSEARGTAEETQPAESAQKPRTRRSRAAADADAPKSRTATTRTRRSTSGATADADTGESEAAAPKSRTTRTRKAPTAAPDATAGDTAPKRRTTRTRKAATAGDASAEPSGTTDAAATPKRRATRTRRSTSEGDAAE